MKNIDRYISDLSNYEIIRGINRGAFGKISLVREKTTNEIFVAKENLNVIQSNSQEIADEEQKKSYREIQILMNIQHDTIIGLKSFLFTNFQNERSITIIMEYMEKGSLAKLLDEEQRGVIEGDYDNTNRQIILIGIAKAMAYIHSRKIIHRDLKPGNVLLNSDLEPKLTDFGLSKYYDPENTRNLSQTQNNCGTLFYMAPEVIESFHYDNKADVYSFGIMMYEIITSTNPYPDFQNQRMTEFTFKANVINGFRPKFDNNMEIKEEIKNLIEKCWDGIPNNRPTFIEIYQSLSQNQKYFLQNVDENKITDYIEKIEEIPDIYKMNQKLTEDLKKTKNKYKLLKTHYQESIEIINRRLNEIQALQEMMKVGNQKQVF